MLQGNGRNGRFWRLHSSAVLHASLILLNLRSLSLSALFGGEGGAVWLEIFHQTTQLLYTALAVALAM